MPFLPTRSMKPSVEEILQAKDRTKSRARVVGLKIRRSRQLLSSQWRNVFLHPLFLRIGTDFAAFFGGESVGKETLRVNAQNVRLLERDGKGGAAACLPSPRTAGLLTSAPLALSLLPLLALALPPLQYPAFPRKPRFPACLPQEAFSNSSSPSINLYWASCQFSLRCNSHIIQPTHLKCIIRIQFLVYL